MTAYAFIAKWVTSEDTNIISISIDHLIPPQKEQNILVPIHAYPVLNTASFPRHVTFSPTPIGVSQTKTVHLRSEIPVEFEYKLSYLQSNPAYSIEKMQGL